MALALNRRFLLQKQLLLSICYLLLIWRRIKQKRAKHKRTKSMWVSRPLFLERRSKGLFKDLYLFDHFYFLFSRALFVLVLEST